MTEPLAPLPPPPLLAAAWLGWLPVLGSPPWLYAPGLVPGGPEQAAMRAAMASSARCGRR
ncbi:MAG TPA: hypothetical protein VIN32_01825 [Candidatus Limnocylindria bacterium]